MQRDYPHALAFFFGSPWAIRPGRLTEMQAILLSHLLRGDTEPKAAIEGTVTKTDAGYRRIGAAAVVPIQGEIFPRTSMLSWWFGGTSSEDIANAVESAANDPKVEHVVLDIDSPGGSVFGAPEAWAKVYAARKLKPITAIANHQAASLAFGFAAQAQTIAVTPGGWVGSLGVIWPRVDETAFEEKLGIKTTVFVATGSPFKAEGRPDVPLTEDERVSRQQMVDAYFAQFRDAVARGRGVKPAKVEQTYGGGRMLLAAPAVEAKVADRIATLEEIVNEVNGVRSGRVKRQVAADLAGHGFPTA